MAKVAFLVKRGVQYDDLEAEEANRGLVWSLRIPTRDGVVAIHNFYNHPDRKLDIEKLMDLCIDEEEAHVLLGDSNLHHPRWGGESLTKTDADGTRLVNLIDLLHMKCMNIPGVKTYARGSHTSGKYTSTLDIAVVSQNIEDRSHYELLMDVFSSDHRPYTVTINMSPERKTSHRYLWSCVNGTDYITSVEEGLKKIKLPKPQGAACVHRVIHAMYHDAIIPAIKQHVPVVRQFEQKRPLHASNGGRQDVTKSARHTNSARNKQQKYRNFIEREAKKHRSAYPLAKRAAGFARPKQMSCTPDFIHDSKTFRTNAEKVGCFVNATWSETSIKGPPRDTSGDALLPKKPVSISTIVMLLQLLLCAASLPLVVAT